MILRRYSSSFIIIVLLIVVGSTIHLQFNPFSILTNAKNLTIILSEFAAMDISIYDKVLLSLLETLEMAFLGTFIGFIVSIPLSLLAAKNISPSYISSFTKGLINLLWSMPTLLYAIILVIVVGLGPTAGVLAVMLSTIGFSGKYLYEIYEANNPSAYEVMNVIGASRLQIVRYVTLPEASPYLISQFLLIFSYNVKESSMLGLVGAGGIGFYIIHYLESIQYSKATLFLLAVTITIILADWISTRLRDKMVRQ